MDPKRLTLRLSEEELADLQWLAARGERTLNQTVRRAIKAAVKNARGEPTSQPQPQAREEVVSRLKGVK